MVGCGEKKPCRNRAGLHRRIHQPSGRQKQLLRLRQNPYGTAVLRAPSFELNTSARERKERVVATDADVFACMKLRAALADNDRARTDRLSTVDLDAKPLGL
jgi:hypothetical protein